MPYMILTAVIAAFVAVLALQNSMMVGVNFFVWSFQMNLVLVVFFSAFCGFLIALIWGLKTKAQSMWNLRKLHEQISLLEDDKKILLGKIEVLMGQRAPAASEQSSASEAAPVDPGVEAANNTPAK